MKTFYLIRHAKSDWKNELLPDAYRPLNERGYTDAQKMSASLNTKKVRPALLITSPAIRAYTTAFIFSGQLGCDPAKILIRPELYDSTAKDYLHVISEIDDAFECVMLFGHNATITGCANRLAAAFTEELPTCAVIGFRNPGSWKQFVKGGNEVLLYDFPKNNAKTGG